MDMGVVPAWFGDTLDRDALPRDALEALHGADRDALALEDRPLLDVELHVSPRPQEARLLGAGVPDAGELLAEHRPVGARRRQRLFDREAVRVDQRAHHVGRVAHALLVGEGRDRDRAGRHEPCAPQGRDDLEAGQHAVAAVVDAGVDDRVDV
jgi:hypothetical protein